MSTPPPFPVKLPSFNAGPYEFRDARDNTPEQDAVMNSFLNSEVSAYPVEITCDVQSNTDSAQSGSPEDIARFDSVKNLRTTEQDTFGLIAFPITMCAFDLGGDVVRGSFQWYGIAEDAAPPPKIIRRARPFPSFPYISDVEESVTLMFDVFDEYLVPESRPHNPVEFVVAIVDLQTFVDLSRNSWGDLHSAEMDRQIPLREARSVDPWVVVTIPDALIVDKVNYEVRRP